MAVSKIQITPEELLAQSNEMLALQSEAEALFSSVSSTLLKVNDSWSPVLANNFMGKINSAKIATKNIVALLGQGAAAAKMSAETFKSIDSIMAKSILGSDSRARAESYSAGGGGFSSGGGGQGSFGSRGEDHDTSFWREQWEMIKEEWNATGDALNWLKKEYGKVPEDLRDKIKSVFPEEAAAVRIASDIITNDLNLDTLETYLDAIGADSVQISAITNTAKVMLDDNSLAVRANAKMDEYMDLGTQNLVDGDIGEGLLNLAKSFGIGLGGGVFGGAADVGTEMLSNFISAYANKAIGAADLIGTIVPGRTGEVICDLSETGITLTDKVTGWLSDLL